MTAGTGAARRDSMSAADRALDRIQHGGANIDHSEQLQNGINSIQNTA